MVVWETEDEYTGPTAAASLPTPQDTPYRTPSRTSRRSRRSTTPPGKGSSSPPLPSTDKRSSKDISNDETISILDPRRFTPTLHANLVAEILSLRRDQEDKLRLIESLETSLHTSREEYENLQSALQGTAKEGRSLKRQLSLLEGGTSSALGELARERDEAIDSAAEAKRRLDTAQKKIRSQDEDSQRVHDLWAKEKDSWEDEKRKFERRVHVAESRLKVVLEEVAAYQAAQANSYQNGVLESEAEDGHRDNDAASVRTMSMTNSIRFSVMNGANGKVNGHSLADELNLDGEDDWQTDNDGRESVHSNYRHVRTMSKESVVSKLHGRNQSMESLKRPGSVARGRTLANQLVLETLEDGISEDEDDAVVVPILPKPVYTDTGIQYSPPPSPKLHPSKPTTPEPQLRHIDVESPPSQRGSPRGEFEIEANQRRKRVHIGRPLVIEPSKVINQMVSAASQTVEEPLSPPKTPQSPYKSPYKSPSPPSSPPAPTLEIKLPSMVSSATQTDPPLPPDFLTSPPPMLVPSISVIPPTSRPTTPREPRLPQYFKHFGCQVNLTSSVLSTSVGSQTEEIRIDKRLAQLPEHLRPDAISSRPPTPGTAAEEGRQFTPVPGNLPPRNPRRLTSKRSLADPPSSPLTMPADAIVDAYPGNNDDGALSSQKAPMKRPHRVSSLFAGFDAGSTDGEDDFEADVSDSEFRTALSAPKPQSSTVKPSKRSSSAMANSMSHEPFGSKRNTSRSSMRPLGGPEVYSSFSLGERDVTRKASVGRAFDKSSVVVTTAAGPSKAGVMRKSAMIQSGIASHQQSRARSPSLPDARDPPFPIPTRASSRRPPISVSAPSDGQRSPTRAGAGDSWHRRGIGRSHYRANSIRKVRSAAAIPVKPRYRRTGSRSPPPPPAFSISTEAPESPGLPPLPSNDLTTPRTGGHGGARYKTHQPQLSTNTANTNGTDLLSNASHTTGVVEAIAQTMVGEWMFKYVRRRKSFGVSEAANRDDNSNDRHKRWVWLAPYERAILWSSKQPSSNSTLMGKSGRKFTIQSVLDVKDDNPSPKGASPLFNRSILILTPQRALKFTAVSAERHYLWLTALSFLAHSTQAVPEITAVVPPKPVPDFEIPRSKPRRPGIRDSIRLTKSKTGFKSATPSIPSMPSVPSSQIGDISTYRNPDTYATLTSTGTNASHQRDSSGGGAEPPYIPRFHERNSHMMDKTMILDRVAAANHAPAPAVHGRKRSNTGGHVPPPLSFRGFSGPAVTGGGGYHHNANNSVAGASIGTAGSSDIYQSQGTTSTGGWGGGGHGHGGGMSTTASQPSQRTSEASTRGPGTANFFEAIGTVRMEAFISPLAFSRSDDYPDEQEEYRNLARRRSKEMRRRASRSRHRDSYNSRGTRTTDDWSKVGDDDFFARDDPFKGF